MLNHPFMLLKSTLERLSSDFWICAVVLFLCGFLLYDPACPLAMGQQVLSVKGQKVNIWGFVSDCSHEIRRCLLLGRKAITNLDSVLKSRDITLPTKVHTVKTMFFPVVMYRCENWTINKVEQQKNWCFWTVMQEKTLESPLDCKGIKPVNLKKINPEYSMEGFMLKLKLQYFGHLMWRVNSLEKTLMLGKIEGKRRGG